jgi:hypothetical protein
MSIMSDVLWDVAIRKNGQPVWIQRYNDEEIYCVECKHPMVAVRGREKQHHFRHKVNSNCSSDSEGAKHYSKKYEIAEILKECGTVKVEGAIEKYRADVLFENEWAFEVVFSSRVSADKMRDLRSNLVIFDFNDRSIWDADNNYHGVLFDEDNFRDIVLSLANQILNQDDVDVCSICRNVKGWGSRLKKGGICFMCDIGWSDESKQLKEDSKRYRVAKMR